MAAGRGRTRDRRGSAQPATNPASATRTRMRVTGRLIWHSRSRRVKAPGWAEGTAAPGLRPGTGCSDRMTGVERAAGDRTPGSAAGTARAVPWWALA